MIPPMVKPTFLPLFQNCMGNGWIDPDAKPTFIRCDTPLECQVLSTEPKFIISDGFHKVACHFTRDALISMKKDYSSTKVKELDKQFLSLTDYAPHMHPNSSDELEPVVHLYKFSIYRHDGEKDPSIFGKPKELSTAQSIKVGADTEKNKRLRKFMVGYKGTNTVPELENVLAYKPDIVFCGKVIKYEKRKVAFADELGKELVDYSKIDILELDATKEAAELIAKEGEETKKDKDQRRKSFAERKKKPRSLGKELTEYMRAERAREQKKQRSATPSFVKEGVAAILAKHNAPSVNPQASIRSISKASIDKGATSRRETERKEKPNMSEMKFTARGFKSFMSWKASSGSFDRETTNVTDQLKKSKAGPMKIGFAAPGRPVRKAFNDWASAATPEKKRGNPEGPLLSRASTKKGKY